MADDAHPTLAGNRCARNTQSGIAYFGKSAGTAEGNICCNNTMNGIYLAGTAAPALRDNTVTGNTGGDVRDARTT
ncbi:MAG TPA: right-handed parallel beta-helix repeat-containing protein [Armatimonadota bacterium]|nr:right-handed parallel beta-helix repeat-containing protein [Armatimonadota bacterium]